MYYDRDNNQQITLCNLLTGYRCTLVSGTAKNRNEYPATFFIKRGPGFELNFCTSVTLSNGFDHSWHQWQLNQDFFNILRDFGGLPPNMTISQLMENLQRYEQLSKELQKKIEKYEKDSEEKAKNFFKSRHDLLFRRIFTAWRMMAMFSKTSLYAQ